MFSTQIQDYHPFVVVCAGLGGLLLLSKLVSIGLTYRRHAVIIRRHGCKPCPAYPHKDFIIGLDIFMEGMKLNKIGGLLENVRARYTRLNTKTFSQRLLGDKIIMTCEPENVKAILAAQFKEFDIPKPRRDAASDVFGHGIFSTNGSEWETSRALLRPNFTRSQVGDIVTFEEHVSKLLARIPRDGSVVDLQELFFMLTLDSATDFLFGYSTNVLDEKDPNSAAGVKFGEAFQYVTEKVGIRTRFGWLAAFIKDPKYESSRDYVYTYIDKYVKSTLDLHQKNLTQEKVVKDKKDREKYVFLEELAKTDFSATKIRDELLHILLAGRDTTASLLGFLFWHLARRPDVWNQLRAEILELGSGIPTFEQIKSLKYMQWVLNETLRLHPIVPVNSREANRDTTLPVGGGKDGKSPIFVPKGGIVDYQVYVMHRRKDLYGEDSDEFKPERWSDLRPGWQYLPFNGGPRICIGQQFALIEASYCAVRLLQTFKSIESKDDSPFREYLTITQAVGGGVQVGLTPA
ncbi:hypothetical protein HYALB_00007641 [Hymenoscyphus albidus]|uniref:Uncharacterized protein n=1 Tax=Hymenoscyphus albidus TaxID=595503 RepID=A0A9N9LB88_9HELO|nr:hypothetical protein HYALB_00007641 [Hymenoscyphus albidus]